MTEKNDYEDTDQLLPMTVNEITLTHWTDRLSACMLERGGRWGLSIRFDKLARYQVESSMRKLLGLTNTAIHYVIFYREARMVKIDCKDARGDYWVELENVESVYNERW